MELRKTFFDDFTVSPRRLGRKPEGSRDWGPLRAGRADVALRNPPPPVAELLQLPDCHDVCYDACIHEGRCRKHRRLRLNFTQADSMAVRCDDTHEHLPWKVEGRGNAFAGTADEAGYPVLFCERLIRTLQQAAAARSISLMTRSTPALADADPRARGSLRAGRGDEGGSGVDGFPWRKRRAQGGRPVQAPPRRSRSSPAGPASRVKQKTRVWGRPRGVKNWWTPRKLSSSRIKGARAHSPGMAIGESCRVIGQAELAQVILAKEVWKQRREQRNGGFFLDDDAARYELAKVCSPVEACMHIVKVIAKVDLASQARAWYDRVSTESDAGDTASGSNPESALRSSPGANSPSSKPCGIHEAPGRVACAVVRYVYVLGRESFGDLSFKASRLREVVQDIDLWSCTPLSLSGPRVRLRGKTA